MKSVNFMHNKMERIYFPIIAFSPPYYYLIDTIVLSRQI